MTDQASERRQVDDGSALQLQEISTALIREGNLDALYGRILDAAISLLSADMGSIQILSPERSELRLLAQGISSCISGLLGMGPSRFRL